MIWSPLQETPHLGRNPVYWGGLFLFLIFQIPIVLPNNLACLLVFRFLTGFVGSPVLATGGASMGDIFPLAKLPYGMGVWGAGAVMGPIMGPGTLRFLPSLCLRIGSFAESFCFDSPCWFPRNARGMALAHLRAALDVRLRLHHFCGSRPSFFMTPSKASKERLSLTKTVSPCQTFFMPETYAADHPLAPGQALAQVDRQRAHQDALGAREPGGHVGPQDGAQPDQDGVRAVRRAGRLLLERLHRSAL